MTVSIDITPMDTDDTVPSPVKSDFDNSSDSGRSEALFSSANSDSTLPSEPPSPTKSTKSQTLFTDTFECLPSTGFEKQAHIIDVDALTKHAEHEGTLQLQDAVATTLYLASPETLRSFLSPTTHTFKVLFKGDRGDKQLVIWRKGVEVFIGTFTHHTTMKSFGFEHVAGLLIGYDGSWHLKMTIGNGFSSTKWAEIWCGDFECYGGVTKMVVDRNESTMQERASALAEDLLDRRFWECKADVKAT